MNLFFGKKYPRHLSDQESVWRQGAVLVWEAFKIVVISLAIIIPVRYYLIKPFYVKGASMEPNFYDHEYLIIDEITYRFSGPKRGEPVVFRYPFDRQQYFIKRIIGLPGETIKISEGKVSIINNQNPQGVTLVEDYLLPAMQTHGDHLVTLSDDEYFLLGDNRTSSLDSRMFGPVKKSEIVGRTLLRGWPIDRAGVLLQPIDYNL